ncbi:MAG TPA: hypothetical protein VHR16_03025 [Candidatus Limnocylindrales bacterium]|jgi:hypothetical protein|nr:hypothetical protein [Candidatus Limnocylindrales bacterium]
MAVYQGARRRAALPLGLDTLGARRDRKPAGERAARVTSRAGRARGRAARSASTRRPSSVGLALVAIVMVFGAAFLSLSQSVRVAATGYDIVRLASERERLQAISQDLRSDVDRLRSEYAIRKQALDAGLGQLGAALIVEAR